MSLKRLIIGFFITLCFGIIISNKLYMENTYANSGYSYNVYHYFDNVLDSSKTESGTSSVATYTAQSYFNNGYILLNKASVNISLAAGQTTNVNLYWKSAYTGQQIVNNMTIGWNLGNTLDVVDSSFNANTSATYVEHYWGNPVTTEAMILEVKKQGFNTIRIPVSWGQHLTSGSEYGNNTITSSWMNRVQEVVDYAYNNGMYVILNTHHEGWLKTDDASYSASSTKLAAIWSQISERFKNYDDRLIFEGMNEPRNQGASNEWVGDASNYNNVNKLNSVFRETVRNSGGNNANRCLMYTDYAGLHYTAINYFEMPDRAVDNKIIATVHAYAPYEYAFLTNGASTYTQTESNSVKEVMNRLYNAYIAKGYPLIIGEFACFYKNNDDQRYYWAKDYIKFAKEYGIKCCYWDEGGAFKGGNGGFSLLKRTSLEWVHPDVVVGLFDGYNNINRYRGEYYTKSNGSFVKFPSEWYVKINQSLGLPSTLYANINGNYTAVNVSWSGVNTSANNKTISYGKVSCSGSGYVFGDIKETVYVGEGATVNDYSSSLKFNRSDINMNGTSDCIDTGLTPLASNQEFTIFIDYVGASSNTNGKYVVACMDGWNGMRIVTESNYYMMRNGTSVWKTFLNRYLTASTARQRVVLQRKSGSNNLDVYFYDTDYTMSKFTLENTFDGSKIGTVLTFGAAKSSKGGYAGFWKGTINDCCVWYDSLDDTVIEEIVTCGINYDINKGGTTSNKTENSSSNVNSASSSNNNTSSKNNTSNKSSNASNKSSNASNSINGSGVGNKIGTSTPGESQVDDEGNLISVDGTNSGDNSLSENLDESDDVEENSDEVTLEKGEESVTTGDDEKDTSDFDKKLEKSSEIKIKKVDGDGKESNSSKKDNKSNVEKIVLAIVFVLIVIATIVVILLKIRKKGYK